MGERGDGLPAATQALLDAVRRAGAPLLVLLSGGRDSVCLLDLAVRAHGPARVRALHVDHGLRAGSAADAEFCADVCRGLGVRLVVERPGPAPARGNLQGWARGVRYAAARRHAAPGERIATAHTLSDQAETVLYRLASSPGRRALLGMAAADGSLVRPLLGFTRAEITAHCGAHGLRWREDPSNADPASARARVRHGLLPALAAVHPAAERNVAATAELLRAEAEVLDELVEREAGAGRIGLGRLRDLSPALRRLVVQRLADAAAGRLVPGAARRADEIAALDEGAIDVGGGVRARVADGVVAFGPSEGRAARRSG
jgi:tRNA(Ile)-lysidine synthase